MRLGDWNLFTEVLVWSKDIRFITKVFYPGMESDPEECGKKQWTPNFSICASLLQKKDLCEFAILSQTVNHVSFLPGFALFRHMFDARPASVKNGLKEQWTGS